MKNQKNSLELEINQLYEEQNKAFKSHKTTKDELHQFTVIKSEFKKIGLNLAELPKYQNVFAEIKRRGFDVIKLLNDVQQIGNLENQIKSSKKILADYNTRIQAAKKDLDSILSQFKKSKQEFVEYVEAVKTVLEFRQNGQDPATIVKWNKILQQNGLDVSQFDKKLQEYKGIVHYLNNIKNELLSYEKQLRILQASVNELSKEKQDLIEETNLLRTELEEKIARVKKEIQHLEATNPLRLFCDSGKDVYSALAATIILLEKLQSILEEKKIGGFILRNAVERLIGELKTELK